MRTLFTLFLLMLSILPCVAHSVVEKDGQYVVNHEWNYNGRKWSCTINIPVEMYRYYQGRAHQSDDMVQFVLSDYDRVCIRGLVDSFRSGGAKADYSSSDNMLNVVNFVQSLRYVTDYRSKGKRDYVRFPVETLVDGVGDCEDMAILAAAILHEMGYQVLLVMLPDHLALAVNCDKELQGTYYTYQGNRYYYLEVTNTGWDIGQIPDTYKSSKATLIPLVYQPHLYLNQCRYHHDSYYSTDPTVPIKVQCQLENAGPGSTKDLSVRLVFRRHDGTPVANKVFKLDEMQEGGTAEYELSHPVPRPFRGTLEVRAEGANFSTETMLFNDINLK